MLTDDYNFGLPDITNSTTKTVSPNIYDATAAKKLFCAGAILPKIKWKTVITADASPTILIEMWAGDATDGDVNDNEAVRNEVLGSSGVVRLGPTGANLASGDTIEGQFAVYNQKTARQYYGLNVTLGGTNPDIVASTSYARLVINAQSNMLGPRAAIPA